MPRLRRRFLPTVGSAPWIRAPLLLARVPGVVIALVVATAILGIAAASGPLFLSSVGSATLTQQITDSCPERSLPGVSNPAVNDPNFLGRNLASAQTGVKVDEGDAAVRAEMAGVGLPDPYRVLIHDAAMNRDVDPANMKLTLYSRADALEHVQVLSSSGADRGVWISDRYAGARGLKVGDTLAFEFGSAPISGIYRDLARDGTVSDLPEYWCSWSDLIVPTLENRPPPFVIVDPQTMYELVPVIPEKFFPVGIYAWWYSPVDTSGMTIADADLVLGQIDRLPYRGGAYQLVGDLPRFVGGAVAARDSVRGPVLPVSLAATALALLLVAAAGFLWAEQRSGEVALLASRGVAAGPIGLKAALEMLLPVSAGAMLGWIGASGLVRLLGPSPLLEPGALRGAAQTVGLAAALGLLTLAILAGLRSRRSVDSRPSRRLRWTLLPWEVGFLLAAVLTYRRARTEGGATAFLETITLNPLLIAFPLAALVGSLLLFARVLSWLLPVLRRRSRRWPPAIWLSIRRIASSAAVTLTVFVLAATPVGVLIYSAGLTGSLVQTVTAKAEIYSGAAHALDFNAEPGYSPDMRNHGTVVTVIRDGEANGDEVQVLGIDPDTFAQFAAWDPSAVGAAPDELVPLVTGAGTRSTAILVRWNDDTPVSEVQLRTTTLSIDVVATAAAFPGLRVLGNRPMIVVDRATVVGSDRYTQRQDELWTDDANLDAALVVLDELGVVVDQVRTPSAFLGQTDLLPIGWTFGYLQTIAALTGVIAVTALLLYLAVQQRQRFAAFHLSKRMGVTNTAHLRSLLSEVGGVLGLAWVAGAAVALVCVQLAYRLLDVNPDFPPGPLLDPPLTLLAVSAAVLVVATAATALAAHAAARSTQASAVLRLE